MQRTREQKFGLTELAHLINDASFDFSKARAFLCRLWLQIFVNLTRAYHILKTRAITDCSHFEAFRTLFTLNG